MNTAEALATLLDLGEQAFIAGFVVFLRVGAAMAMLPGFGEQSIPVRVRLVLTMAFTAVTAPAVAGDLPEMGSAAPTGLLLATEVIIGLVLGGVLRLFIHVLQMAGSIAAQTVSLSQILGGQSVDPQPAIGHVMTMAGIALAMATGLHVKIVGFFVHSYDLMPAGRFPSPLDIFDWGVARTAKAFALAFGLAAPFVITSVIYNLTLGVINRAMPQLMVAFVGAPAITLGGLAILAMATPFILQIWIGAFDGFLIDPAGASR